MFEENVFLMELGMEATRLGKKIDLLYKFMILNKLLKDKFLKHTWLDMNTILNPSSCSFFIFFVHTPWYNNLKISRSYCANACLSHIYYKSLTLLLRNTTCPVLANSVDPDQLASSEANWSGSALFVIKYANFYQKPSSRLAGN